MNEKKRIDGGALVGGLVLIAVGLLFLLDRFDFAEFGDLFRWYWPMIIVFIGLAKLFRRGAFWSGLWLMTIGAWLQVAHLRLFGLTYRTSWPLLLIALGGGIIARTVIESLRPRHEEDRHEA